MLTTLALALALQAAAPPPSGDALRLMSFNIRYGTAQDGENRWELRKHLVLSTIERFEPDLVAVQEALDFQLEFLLAGLEGFAASGGFREGERKGEYTGILYRADRLEKLEEGVFWLSETPDTVGSVGWDASLPRICAWARFRERRSGRRFAALGTHLDHRGARSREMAALLLEQRATALEEAAVLLLGDLNAEPGSPPLRALAGAGFHDAWRELHPESTAGSTFHGFRGGSEGRRIDYVLMRGDGWRLHSAAIDRTSDEGRFPSDHYPVTALLSLGGGERLPPDE